MTNQVGPGLAKPAYGSELRARDRNEVRVSGFHRGPQRNYRLQQGRIESCSPSCQSDHAKAVAKRDAFIESRMTRECHVRFCERLGAKLPWPTHQTGEPRGSVSSNLTTSATGPLAHVWLEQR